MKIENIDKAKDYITQVEKIGNMIKAISESNRPCELMVTEVFGNVHIKYFEDKTEKAFASINQQTFEKALLGALKDEKAKFIATLETL